MIDAKEAIDDAWAETRTRWHCPGCGAFRPVEGHEDDCPNVAEVSGE